MTPQEQAGFIPELETEMTVDEARSLLAAIDTKIAWGDFTIDTIRARSALRKFIYGEGK